MLPESDSAHCVRVLRMRSGDTIEVVDGKGGLHRCILRDAHPKHAFVDVTESVSLPKVWAGNINIAIAPTKHNDRMGGLWKNWLKSVSTASPPKVRYSERKDINVERLEK